MKKINFVPIETVIEAHDSAIMRFGGLSGLRDKTLLEAAVAQPAITFGGTFIHRTIYAKAAAYIFHIIKNHPFVDGNKRTGVITAIAFLDENGGHITASFDALYTLAIDVAASKLDTKQIAHFLRAHAQKR